MTRAHRLAAAAMFAGLTFASGCGTDAEAAARRDRISRPGRAVDAADYALPAQSRAPDLGSLRRAHPRLLATAEDFDRLKHDVAAGGPGKESFDRVRADADRVLRLEPVAYDRGGDLIEEARKVLQRTTQLGVAYRVTGDRRYAARAAREMTAVAGWPDWGRTSFLATAEMTTAVALGYDWCYEAIEPRDLDVVRRAILDKGLRPGLRAYDDGAFWVAATHNWNLVCNGGLTVGALAIADDEPATAKRVLGLAGRSIRNGLGALAPDGGWDEGTTYWNYATRYAAFYLSSLRTALGTDGGAADFAGMRRAGQFREHTIGPTGKSFNFADAREDPGAAPQMFWMAAAFNRPDYAAFERTLSAAPGALDLIWAIRDEPAAAARPLDAMFRGTGVASFRGAWADPDATWLAVKGGTNRAHHGNLDLGTFVLDALGQRWVVELGPDRYDLPKYTDPPTRWNYYRCRTTGHNTLTVGGADQYDQAEAPLTAFASGPDRSHAVTDLTRAYRGTGVDRALRGVALVARRDVLVQDDVDSGGADGPLVWAVHTRATVTLGGSNATLTQGGRSLRVRILSPAGATFTLGDPHRRPPQDPNDGVTKLEIRLALTRPVRLAVQFTPGDAEPMPIRLEAVKAWSAR